jgi:chitinase
MYFALPFLLGLARLANTAYNPSLTKINSTDIATRDVNGYRSVAYFVNWVCVIYIRHYWTITTK